MTIDLQKEKQCPLHQVREFKECYSIKLWTDGRVLPICLITHEKQVVETERKEINNSKYDPKNIEIQEGFIEEQASYSERTRYLNAKWQEDGPRSSLLIQKRHNNVLLPPHTVIKRRTLL